MGTNGKLTVTSIQTMTMILCISLLIRLGIIMAPCANVADFTFAPTATTTTQSRCQSAQGNKPRRWRNRQGDGSMGREIKRVALDFDWPLFMVWKGYLNPYDSQKCKVCDGSGCNPETKQISDDWYDFDGTGRRWSDNITDDEVEALFRRGRLARDFWGFQAWYDEDENKWIGWIDGIKQEVKNLPPFPSADEVNRWSRNGLGHDSLNHWICLKTRAKRLGVFGECPVCDGGGEIWFSDRVKELSENWYEDERYDPPTGEGWQLWETVSEGSPVSPVFEKSEDLEFWLIGEGYSEGAAKSFIESGWVMSGAMVDGKFYKDIESAVLGD